MTMRLSGALIATAIRHLSDSVVTRRAQVMTMTRGVMEVTMTEFGERVHAGAEYHLVAHGDVTQILWLLDLRSRISFKPRKVLFF